jgi:hypothetical protein
MQLFSYMICLDISSEVLTPICNCFCRSETSPKHHAQDEDTEQTDPTVHPATISQLCLPPSSSLKNEWAKIRSHPPPKAVHDMIAIIKQYMKTEKCQKLLAVYPISFLILAIINCYTSSYFLSSVPLNRKACWRNAVCRSDCGAVRSRSWLVNSSLTVFV